MVVYDVNLMSMMSLWDVRYDVTSQVHSSHAQFYAG